MPLQSNIPSPHLLTLRQIAQESIFDLRPYIDSRFILLWVEDLLDMGLVEALSDQGHPAVRVTPLGLVELDVLSDVLVTTDTGVKLLHPHQVSLGAPTITSFTPATGAVGTAVTITGTNLSGAAAVAFNGVAAAFTVMSATSINATVPAGASTGTLAVTTPSGTATSTGSFTVSSAGAAPAPAPANHVVNDAANTFSADLVFGYAALNLYRYSEDGGTTWIPATTGGVIGNGRITVPVGNQNIAIGQVLLGVAPDSATGRPAGATVANATAYTYTAPASGGYDVFITGNSLAAGGGPADANSWPAMLSRLVDSRFRVHNNAVSGQTMGSLLTNIQPQLLSQHNAGAVTNFVFFQELVNGPRAGISTQGAYDEFVEYSRQAAAGGFVPVPLTGTPTTITAGSTTDINALSQAVSASIRAHLNSSNSQAPAWTDYVDLSLNNKVGAYGTAANGQDAGYSSFNPNYYYDGTHFTTLVNSVVARMVFDHLLLLVDGTPIPDQSQYPLQPTLGVPMTFQDLTAQATATDTGLPAGNRIEANDQGQFNGQARSVQQLTAGSGAAGEEYRGSLFATASGIGGAGFFSTAHQGVAGGVGWLDEGVYLNSGAAQLWNGNTGGAGIAGGFADGTNMEWRVYTDRTELYFDGQKKAEGPAPVFPLWAGFVLQGHNLNAAFTNCRILVVA